MAPVAWSDLAEMSDGAKPREEEPRRAVACRRKSVIVFELRSLICERWVRAENGVAGNAERSMVEKAVDNCLDRS